MESCDWDLCQERNKKADHIRVGLMGWVVVIITFKACISRWNVNEPIRDGHTDQINLDTMNIHLFPIYSISLEYHSVVHQKKHSRQYVFYI
jgi:hypothetical protein